MSRVILIQRQAQVMVLGGDKLQVTSDKYPTIRFTRHSSLVTRHYLLVTDLFSPIPGPGP